MPKTNIDYSKSVIYKIEHADNPELLYVGSTTDFTRRKTQHKHACINGNVRNHNIKLYQMIRSNGGFNEFKMMVIAQYPCNNKIELLIEEERIIKELKATLNGQKAHRSDKDKFDYFKIYNKEYYHTNKEKNKEQKKIRDKAYHEENKEEHNKKK